MNVYDWWCVIITSRVNNFIKFLSLFLVLFLFLANVKYITASVISSLGFIYRTLIPSLFPFMVISSIILYTTRVQSDFKLINFVLDNCKIYANEILIGWICGFVIGAKGICEKYKLYNDIESFNRSVFLSSNAGAGFVIGCVGGVIYKNIWFGIYLYIVQILSALLIFKLKGYKKTYSKNIIYDTPIPFFSAIVKAVKVSTGSIITICGFNIFFSTLCDLINVRMGLTVGNIKFAINNIIMDFSKGSFCVLELNNKLLCYFLTGFCVGFGGISVHLQIFSECEGYPLNKLKFTILKFMQGFICGLFSLTYSFI